MCITQVCRGLWSKGHKNFPHLCIRTPVESLHTNLRATKPLSYLEFGVKSYWIVPSEPFPFSPHPRHNNRNPKPFLFIPDTQQREPPPTMPPPPPSQKAPNPLSSLPLSSLTLSSSPSSPPSSPSGTDPRPNQARPAHQPPFPSARRTRPRALPAPAALHDRPRQHAARLLRPTRPAPSDLSPPPPPVQLPPRLLRPTPRIYRRGRDFRVLQHVVRGTWSSHLRRSLMERDREQMKAGTWGLGLPPADATR